MTWQPCRCVYLGSSPLIATAVSPSIVSGLVVARAILADLEAGGYIKEIEPLSHDVGTCYRCHTNIEPRL